MLAFFLRQLFSLALDARLLSGQHRPFIDLHA